MRGACDEFGGLYMKSSTGGKIIVGGKEYSASSKEINLDSRNLERIPDNLNQFPHLKRIYLLGNKITKIENLENLNDLEEISLSYNQISRIENLKNLPKLKDFCIIKNPVKSIDKNTYSFFKDTGVKVNYKDVDEYIKEKKVRIE